MYLFEKVITSSKQPQVDDFHLTRERRTSWRRAGKPSRRALGKPVDINGLYLSQTPTSSQLRIKTKTQVPVFI